MFLKNITKIAMFSMINIVEIRKVEKFMQNLK